MIEGEAREINSLRANAFESYQSSLRAKGSYRPPSYCGTCGINQRLYKRRGCLRGAKMNIDVCHRIYILA